MGIINIALNKNPKETPRFEKSFLYNIYHIL